MLGNALSVADFVFLMGFFCFPLVILCGKTMHDAGIEVSQAGNIIAEGTFILSYALFLTLVSFIVSLEKKINPEKKGNVFDVHFSRKWLGSMDEAELMKTAKASQKAYVAGTRTGILLWVVAFISMLFLRTGILPIICVTTILLVMTITAELHSR